MPVAWVYFTVQRNFMLAGYLLWLMSGRGVPSAAVKGAVTLFLAVTLLILFDELNCEYFPGETAAVQAVLGSNNLELRRSPHQSYGTWAVYGR